MVFSGVDTRLAVGFGKVANLWVTVAVIGLSPGLASQGGLDGAVA